MQQHANSLANLDNVRRVTFIGYAGEKCYPQVESNNKIHKVYLPSSQTTSSQRGLLSTLWKGAFLCFQLVRVLVSIPSYDCILIQNPPSLPIALIAFILSYFYNNSSIIIDWHNLGNFLLYFYREL